MVFSSSSLSSGLSLGVDKLSVEPRGGERLLRVDDELQINRRAIVPTTG
jgi:hypothetical protein